MALTQIRFTQTTQFPERVYLDANVLAHARDEHSRKHQSAKSCLIELAAQGCGLCVSPLVIDELWWALFRVSYRQTWGRQLTAEEYKKDAEIWRDHWPAVRRISEQILTWERLVVLDHAVASEVVRLATELVNVNHLGPRDAFHLAIALNNAIPAFVTADSDFNRVELPPDLNLVLVKI